ncbi:MAG: ATP-binding protein [Anaerovoracaceae bacterium]|nr:ATP-binding protein [Bacillota bacterium]MDY2670748.1 ATP-binding protein [Anaerovoracaceae bacterium]
MADKLKLSVPAKPEYTGVVRLAVSSAASAAGFSVDDIEDITIAVSEVCTHIFCSGMTTSYEVSCEIEDNSMTIVVDDIRNGEKEEEVDFHPCFCLPVSSFFPELYDPSICMIMLRALMDEVSIYSCSGGDVLIKMIKNN